jgi:hypothetical protein
VLFFADNLGQDGLRYPRPDTMDGIGSLDQVLRWTQLLLDLGVFGPPKLTKVAFAG